MLHKSVWGEAMSNATVVLRFASTDDAKILFEWRNDPTTRTASHNTYEVRFEDHLTWLEKSLANPRRMLFVAELNGIPVGTVRADRSDDAWTISWTVAPSYRGSGVGKAIVLKLARSITDPIRAEVKSENIASIRIAEHAGMRLICEVAGILHFERTAL